MTAKIAAKIPQPTAFMSTPPRASPARSKLELFYITINSCDSASVADYDAIVLPGGQINPDLLRVNADALKLIRGFYDAGKTVAAVCHAPWLLIETGIAKGRKMTSYHSIKTDVVNAGGNWEDSEVVTDNGVITSRNPGDLEAFSKKIIEEVREGKHQRRAA